MVKMNGEVFELIAQYNPLLLRGKRKELLMFEDKVKFYYTWLSQLRERFPKGYIETALYLVDEYFLTRSEASSEVFSGLRHKVVEEIYLVNWNGLSTIDYYHLRDLAHFLHRVLETPFDAESFRQAFENYSKEKIYG